jgi:hypothetical protein
MIYTKKVNKIREIAVMQTLFKYVREDYPQTKLIIAVEKKELYFSFLGIEIDECIGENELVPVDWYRSDLLNFIGYLLFSRQMSTKDDLKLRELARIYFDVDHTNLWKRGGDYIPMLNGRKVVLNSDLLTIYSWQVGNYPTDYLIDQGIYGSYLASEEDVNYLVYVEAEKAIKDLSTI